MKRILVVELWNIGDVILTMPFLAQLRAIFPGAEVTLLARPHAAVLLGGTGLVDRFIVADLTWQMESQRFNPLAYDWREFLRVVGELRTRSFDIAFQCRPHVREYVLVALSGARRRIGLRRRGWSTALTDPVSLSSLEIQKKDAWLRLLQPFGDLRSIETPRLHVSPEERSWADDFLARADDSCSALVAIHPGASVAEKRWPIERFEEVARQLARTPGVKVLALVEPEGYGSTLGAVEGVIPAKVGLRQMVALLERCRLLICNDSGPMHIAAALGIHTVAVFGSGIHRHFAPVGDRHESVTAEPGMGSSADRALGRHPYEDVALVPVSSILEAAQRALEKGSTNTSGGEQARLLLNHARR